MEYIYAALLLHKAGKEVNEANLKSVIAAAGIKEDDAKVKSLIVSLNGVDMDKELESASMMSAAPASASAPAEAKKEEEAPKEEKHEAAAEGLGALFG